MGAVGFFERGTGLQKNQLVDQGLPAIHYGQIYTHYGNFTQNTISFVTPEDAKKFRHAKPGDVLVATTSENDDDLCKSVAWIGQEDLVFSGDCCRYSSKLNAKYVSYFFASDSFQRSKRKYITGTKVRRIAPSALEKIKIPVPPLEVQDEIVRILDSFTKLEAELEAELEARRKQYEYYRDSLLNFENLNSRVGGGVVRLLPLNDVCAKVSSGGTPKRNVPGYFGGSIPWLRTQDVNFNEIFETSATITELGLKNSSASWVKENSIVIAMYGATAAKAAVAKIPLTTNQACCNLEINSAVANYRYVFHVVSNNYEQLKSLGRGSQSNINASIIKQYEIPVPPLAEQERIVAILDKFDALVNDLSSGLPAEIAARRKQYEYYRDQLLTFTPAK